MKKKRLRLISLLALLIMVSSLPVSANEQTKQIKDLPTGSIVYDPSWTWEHKTGDGYTGSGVRKSVDWMIVAKNHPGYSSNSVTLISNELIGKHAFDTGNNSHWGNSSIKSFLNSTFYNSFSDGFKNSTLNTTLNVKAFGGSRYSTTSKIYLPSSNELGAEDERNESDGVKWSYMSGNSSRTAKNNTNKEDYSTRTPNMGWGDSVRSVGFDGGVHSYSYCDSKRVGIRPALNIKSDTLVKQVGSKWEIVYTKPDTTAPNITLSTSGTSKTNQDVTISANAVDPDIAGADTSGVKRIQKPDGSWVTGSTTTYTVSNNGTYVFKAEDNAGNIASKSITISNINKDKPVIALEPYNKEWTNKDIVVKAKVDKGTLNEESHTFTENGVFNFIAIDEYGNRAEKAVVIDNIDKTPPKMKINVK